MSHYLEDFSLCEAQNNVLAKADLRTLPAVAAAWSSSCAHLNDERGGGDDIVKTALCLQDWVSGKRLPPRCAYDKELGSAAQYSTSLRRLVLAVTMPSAMPTFVCTRAVRAPTHDLA